MSRTDRPLNKRDLRTADFCIRRAWFEFHGVEPDPGSAVFLGRPGAKEFELIAKRRWQDGRTVPFEPGTPEDAYQRTLTARGLHDGPLFEATLLADGLMTRCDVWEPGRAITEIKSSKSDPEVKSEQLRDLTFQALVAEAAGEVGLRYQLARVNGDFVLESQFIDPHAITSVMDVTDLVRQELPAVAAKVDELRPALVAPEPPEAERSVHCVRDKGCPFYSRCHPNPDPDDLARIAWLTRKNVAQLREQGLRQIQELEAEHVSKPLALLVKGYRVRRTIVRKALVAQLQNLPRPWHFIDFEVAAPIIPVWPGSRPFAPHPFQWSLHRLDSLEAEPVHGDFLSTTGEDPRQAFVDSLLPLCEARGTVIVYSKYENQAIKKLAAQGVSGADRLVPRFESAFDLEFAVKGGAYLHGSYGYSSIKRLIPCILEWNPYDDLPIADGDAAAAEYLRMIGVATTDVERERIAANLRSYCRWDTEAMVILFRYLATFPDPTD